MKVICINGQKVYVSEEVYVVLTKSAQKERYLNEDLKNF